MSPVPPSWTGVGFTLDRAEIGGTEALGDWWCVVLPGRCSVLYGLEALFDRQD